MEKRTALMLVAGLGAFGLLILLLVFLFGRRD